MTELAILLDDIAALLEGLDDTQWAKWLRRDAEAFAWGDLAGARHFLQAFGGMGSLNDSYGYVSPGNSSLTIHGRIDRKIGEAWKWAKAITKNR